MLILEIQPDFKLFTKSTIVNLSGNCMLVTYSVFYYTLSPTITYAYGANENYLHQENCNFLAYTYAFSLLTRHLFLLLGDEQYKSHTLQL